MKKVILLVIGCWLSAAFAGCGYTTRSMISNKFRSIYITPFVNKIDFTQETYVASKYRLYRPLLETEITKEVINKFVFDGNLRPREKESADLLLKANVVDFRKDVVKYDDNGDPGEYRVNIAVNIELWDNKENKLIWQENNFTGYISYFPANSTLQNVTPKSTDGAVNDAIAVTDAIKDLARRIVERTVEQW